MINNEKVSLMTKLAIYENRNEEDIKLSKYFKMDYIRYNVIKTIISVTIAYVCIVALIVFYNIEDILADAFELDYTVIGIEMVVGYIMMVIVFGLISFMVYSDKIKKSRNNLTKYNKGLRQLQKIYDEEKKGM